MFELHANLYSYIIYKILYTIKIVLILIFLHKKNKGLNKKQIIILLHKYILIII